MAVELDVMNRDGSLAPGMYPTVKWPVRRARPALFVPKTSVVTTTERTFVIRNQNGQAEWVDVKKGVADGDLVEVMGNLKAGDKVVRRATDEIRDGTPIQINGQVEVALTGHTSQAEMAGQLAWLLTIRSGVNGAFGWNNCSLPGER